MKLKRKLVYAYNPKNDDFVLKKVTSEPIWKDIVIIYNLITFKTIKNKVSDLDILLKYANENNKKTTELENIKKNTMTNVY